MAQQAFPYYLFGNYVIELGRYFKNTFKNFQIQPNDTPITAQVFFGAPRAAFRYYMEQFNGLIKLPMINYNIANAERKVEYEKPVYIHAPQSFNPATGTMNIMRFPSIYEVTYQVDIWNNNLRERDMMMHRIINSFPMGDAWLIHYPDKVNYPDTWLPMPHRLDLTFKDETELDNLDIKETRDRIRTSFTITCTRVFVPYMVYEVPAISWIHFDSYVNEENGNLINDNEYHGQAQAVKETLLKASLEIVGLAE